MCLVPLISLHVHLLLSSSLRLSDSFGLDSFFFFFFTPFHTLDFPPLLSRLITPTCSLSSYDFPSSPTPLPSTQVPSFLSNPESRPMVFSPYPSLPSLYSLSIPSSPLSSRPPRSPLAPHRHPHWFPPPSLCRKPWILPSMLDACQLASSSTVCRSCPRLSERVRETNTQGLSCDTLPLLLSLLLLHLILSLRQPVCVIMTAVDVWVAGCMWLSLHHCLPPT